MNDETQAALVAYHNRQEEKDAILAQLAAHRRADELVKGQYWEGGKGCAVGCTIHSGNHMEYERRFGIPVMLARLEDRVFEGLPNEHAQMWPERFMGAIAPGADLSLVGWKFLWWLLTDVEVNPGIAHPTVAEAVKACADAIYPLTKGDPFDQSAAWSAARAAWSAVWSAARSAARSAESAVWSAAWSAESAVWSVESAARSAESAAWSAARSAESAAWSAARSAAYVKMADKLVELTVEAGAARQSDEVSDGL